MRVEKRERGAALPLALVVLVVLGALASRLVVVAVAEQRMARAMHDFAYAAAAAHEGLVLRVAEWDESLAGLGLRDSASFRGAVPTTTGWYHGWVQRLSHAHYVVTVEGLSASGVVRTRMGVLVRVVASPVAPDSAGEAQGEPRARPLASRAWLTAFE